MPELHAASDSELGQARRRASAAATEVGAATQRIRALEARQTQLRGTLRAADPCDDLDALARAAGAAWAIGRIERELPQAEESLRGLRGRAYTTAEREKELEARARRLLDPDAARDRALRSGVHIADAEREIARELRRLIGEPQEARTS